MTTTGHVTRQPTGVLECGSVNRRLKLTERGVTGAECQRQKMGTGTDYYTSLAALCRDYPGEPVPER